MNNRRRRFRWFLLLRNRAAQRTRDPRPSPLSFLLCSVAGARGLCLLLLSVPLHGQVLPAGTYLEARFSTATGSRISHRGDAVTAIVIAPVPWRDSIIIPQGARLQGTVENVIRLGFGLKNRTAGIEYRFSTIEFADGAVFPIDGRVVKIDTAKERVDSHGVVQGVHALASLPSASTFYTLQLMVSDPVVGIPVWGIKALIAPSANPEIYFPPGTEFVLRLRSGVNIPSAPGEQFRVAAFSETAVAARRGLLQKPSYFRAWAGKRPSDLVNLLFVGSRRQIDSAFRAAGWNEAERKSPVALYRMYNAVTRRMGYRNAPMNSLRLNGKVSDFVYQKSLNTVAERHHIRFWRETPKGDVWLGAATEDVALRFRLMHWTHYIDPAIDNERAKVVNDLAFTGCVDSASLVSRQSIPESLPVPESRAEPSVITDGDIAAVQLNACARPNVMPGVGAQLTPHRTRWLPRMMMSFRDDLIRSNPFFTAFNTFRCIGGRRSREKAGTHSPNGSGVRSGLDWLKTQQTGAAQTGEAVLLQ